MQFSTFCGYGLFMAALGRRIIGPVNSPLPFSFPAKLQHCFFRKKAVYWWMKLEKER
jgi:hypothetical protein